MLRLIKWPQLILWRRDGKEKEGSREFTSKPIVWSVAQISRGLPSSAKNTLPHCLSQRPVIDRTVPPRRLCFPFLGIPRKGSSKALTSSLPGFLTCTCQAWPSYKEELGYICATRSEDIVYVRTYRHSYFCRIPFPLFSLNPSPGNSCLAPESQQQLQ